MICSLESTFMVVCMVTRKSLTISHKGHVAYEWSTDHLNCHTSIHTYRPILITLLCHSLRNRFWSGPQGHSLVTTQVQLQSSPAWVCGLAITLPCSILSESAINYCKCCALYLQSEFQPRSRLSFFKVFLSSLPSKPSCILTVLCLGNVTPHKNIPMSSIMILRYQVNWKTSEQYENQVETYH
jgi:hypothetical protein